MALFNHLLSKEIINEDLKLSKQSKGPKAHIGFTNKHDSSPRYKIYPNSSNNNQYIEYYYVDGEPIIDSNIKMTKDLRKIKILGYEFGKRYYNVLDYNAKHCQELTNKELTKLIQDDLNNNNYSFPNNEIVYYDDDTKTLKIKEIN